MSLQSSLNRRVLVTELSTSRREAGRVLLARAYRWVRNPFSATLDVSSLPDEVQEEFLDQRNDSPARDLFQEKSVTQFWCAMHQSYSKVNMLALRVLLPFASTYLYEAGFSTLVHIKSKTRNRLDVKDEMRLVLTNTPPRIQRLAAQMQPQPSH
ncbi:zinc finger BED domain-containing protein 5-like [Homarus americanus]|uniref:zinc finger BED domain-containing protein 5-like n=1 Tax=Homarus americanus TaxID=6706 RepID=UPI001C4502D6|nr:zinc finger BED domain-containing protein 5-like [Homarus americanus]